jgi:DNA processing protein
VMAVPGNPLDARAGGCNQLIRDGATLVRSAEDVAEALAVVLGRRLAVPGPAAPPPGPAAARDDAPLAPRLVARLGPNAVAEDLLTRELAAPAAAVSAALVELELEGRVRRHPGGLVSLA